MDNNGKKKVVVNCQTEYPVSKERYELHKKVSPLLTGFDFDIGRTHTIREQADQIQGCNNFDRKIKYLHETGGRS